MISTHNILFGACVLHEHLRIAREKMKQHDGASTPDVQVAASLQCRLFFVCLDEEAASIWHFYTCVRRLQDLPAKKDVKKKKGTNKR